MSIGVTQHANRERKQQWERMKAEPSYLDELDLAELGIEEEEEEENEEINQFVCVACKKHFQSEKQSVSFSVSIFCLPFSHFSFRWAKVGES